jgi:hypothetical protein
MNHIDEIIDKETYDYFDSIEERMALELPAKVLSYSEYLSGYKSFPGFRTIVAFAHYVTEYEVISALKVDFERWKLILLDLPNSEEENRQLIDSYKLQEVYETDDGEIREEKIRKNKFSVKRINEVKQYPNELRLKVQYSVKDNIKSYISTEKNSDIKKELNRYLIEVCRMIDPDYQSSRELIEEIEYPYTKLQKPNNTHNQQFALLERLGVIEFLKNEYPILNTTTKMGELVANITNRNQKNSTEMARYTGTKNQESNLHKNKTVVDKILVEIGILQEG